MDTFYFDIESYKTENQLIIDDIASELGTDEIIDEAQRKAKGLVFDAENKKPPMNLKDPEKIDIWYSSRLPDYISKAKADGEQLIAQAKAKCELSTKSAIEKTVFDGGAGQILAFSCAVNDEAVINLYRDDKRSEVDLLNEINETLSSVFLKKYQKNESTVPVVWCGQYITGFDLRFLWKRFIVNQVRTSVAIPYNAKPWDKNVYDTMFEWGGTSNDKKSMDFICKSLGIKGKDGFDGSMVGAAWEAGEYEKISSYCGDDVERTRKIHKRMVFK